MNSYCTLAVLSLLAGCKDSSVGPTATVTPEAGGMVMSEDKRVKLMVPAGAVGANTTISIKPLPSDKVPKDAFPPGVAYQMEPDGMHFDKPIQVSFAVSPADFAAAKLPSPKGIKGVAGIDFFPVLGVTSTSSNGTEEELDTVFNARTQAMVVTADLSHFSEVRMHWGAGELVGNLVPNRYEGFVGETAFGILDVAAYEDNGPKIEFEISSLKIWSDPGLVVTTNTKPPFPILGEMQIPLKFLCTDVKSDMWGASVTFRKTNTTRMATKTLDLLGTSYCKAAPPVDMAMAPVDMAMAPCLGAPPKITHEITPKKVGFGGSFWVGFEGSGFGTPQVFLGSKLVPCEIDFMDNKSTELKCTVDKSHTTGVVTGQACGMTIASNQTITVLPRDNPKITKMSMTAPPEGDVTIEGTNFLSNATVLFLYNDTPAASYSMRSDMKIIAKLPPGVVGMVGVQVLSSDGATAWSDTLVDIK